MNMNDPYDSGTPKYSTATDIYEKLCEIYYNEEASILGEMFADVSYENQDYYYIDKGMKLKEKFDAVSDKGNNLWLMDLANSKLAAQNDEYHLLGDLDDWIYEAIVNEDLAKKIGFKALFVKYLLFDDSSKYKDFREEFESKLYELNRFGFDENKNAWQKVINAHNFFRTKTGTVASQTKSKRRY